MSIVTEALRKAQKKRFNEVKKDIRKKEVSSLDDIYSISERGKSRAREKKVKGLRNLFLIYALFFCTVVVLCGLVFLWTVHYAARQEQHMTNLGHLNENEKILNSPSTFRQDIVVPFAPNKKNTKIPRASLGSVNTSLPILNGIMFSSEYPTAILNDKIVAPGDTVSGYKVIEISPDFVKISDNMDSYKLNLK